MNFLSHFYFVRHKENPYYTLGSILPDLFRNHRSDWKFSREIEDQRFNGNEDLVALFEGWKLHVQVDALFHNSPPFKLHSSGLRTELKEIFATLPKRPFFLAHVGYELMLDSLLIRNNLIQTKQFYDNLSDCDTVIVDAFMNKLGVTETNNFHAFLTNFIDTRYLESYRNTENIVYALDRIGQRVWTERFGEKETENALILFERFLRNLEPVFLDVFDLLEAQLQDDEI